MSTKRVAVIGLGQFGMKIATTLSQKGNEVIAIDIDPQRVEDIKDLVYKAICLDSTEEKALRSIGVDRVDIGIVAIGDNVQANLLAATLLKQMKIDKVIARSITSLQNNILHRIGVDEIINIEEQMGITIANNVTSTKIAKHVEISPGHSMIEVEVPNSLKGKSIGDINFRKKYNVNVIAIKSRIPHVNDYGESVYKEYMNDVPGAMDTFKDGDIMLVIGSDDNINNLNKGLIK